MPTVTSILRRQKMDKRGRCPIWLRISDGNGDRYQSLGVKVTRSQWNKRKGRVNSDHPNYHQVNLLLQRKEAEAEEEILKMQLGGKQPSADQVMESIIAEGSGDFFAFTEDHLQDLLARDKIARYRRLKATLEKLKSFAGAPLPFEKITVALLHDFESYCLGVGNKQSTAATNLSDIRALFNQAERFDLTGDTRNPFRRFTIKQGETPERVKLSFDEIERLKELDLSGDAFCEMARDFFLVAFYSGGIRFSDVATMTHARIVPGPDGLPDRLAYTAGKTGKQRSLKITPPAKKILERYLDTDVRADAFIFPFLEGYDLTTHRRFYNAKSSVNTRINKCLKKLAAAAEITDPDGSPKRISTHIARHSFADAARRGGWGLYDISKALQHSSLKVTERYLKDWDESSLDDAFMGLFPETDS